MATPPEHKELEAEIADVVRLKEAVEGQQFEAGRLRDKEKELLNRREAMESEAKASGLDLFDEVDEEAVAEVLSLWTGIPVYKLTEEETQKLLRMEDELHKRIVGQHDAITAISRAIRRSRAGLKDPRRPIGSFIFSGPTGVGKTELAKTLAEFLFGDETALLSLDMSEYQEKHYGQPTRRLPRLCRLRRRRPAHREGAPEAVLGRAVRRGREGPSRCLQHAAADS